VLTETSLIDKIEVMPETGFVQVRRVNRIIRDGVTVAQTFHRVTHLPGADVSAEGPLVQAICRAAWCLPVE
jgi:hypothetical protein